VAIKKETKEIIRTTNFCRNPKKSKKVKKTKNHPKTITLTLFREVKRKKISGYFRNLSRIIKAFRVCFSLITKRTKIKFTVYMSQKRSV
jgi:hypothetical protein